MTMLRIFAADAPDHPVRETSDFEAIRAALADRGIGFERWDTATRVVPGAEPDTVLAAYRSAIDTLGEEGFQSADVVSLGPDHPKKDELRKKFLGEHTHSDDEIRFFVAGSGLFGLHIGDEVVEITCETDDFLRVPAGTKHWFDMGPEPSFVCIRVFDSPDGWAADFTGDDIADRFSRHGE